MFFFQKILTFVFVFLPFQDEYNLNPGLEWEDEFTGRSLVRTVEVALRRA